ncbi:MAG: type II toxin-antitoxin system RelE/ParE family toxin, partial [Candidatus Scalindua sp.]|nr:type II toxin-antitoxin system RelE/ParE family toxin [Candidatus Scalindua sp.]
MVKVKWSKDSIADLKGICSFIALDSPFYAKIFNDRVFEMVEHLEFFTGMGRKVPESDDPKVREIFYKGYRIIYQIKEDHIEIITVI